MDVAFDDLPGRTSPTDPRSFGELYGRVGRSAKEIHDQDLRINLFVTKVLMPIVEREKALVLCRGQNDCPLAVAVGKAFTALNARRGGTVANGQGPRLISLVSVPQVAKSLVTPGTNAYALAGGESEESAMSNTFLTKEYKKWLSNSPEKYDVIEGSTETIMFDERDSTTGWWDSGPVTYFENTFASAFSGKVPSMNIQWASMDGGEGVSYICECECECMHAHRILCGQVWARKD